MGPEKSLFTMALGLEEPWSFDDVSFDAKRKQIDFKVAFKSGSRFACPSCGAADQPVHDTRRRELTRIHTLADGVVVVSLLLAPIFGKNLAFLRVLRGLRLIHAYHLLRDLRRESLFFRRHEDAILAAVNLSVFIFITTSFVFVLAFEDEAGAAGYIDALYFTVATLTTTGFGDITMTTPGGKLLSVFIMVVGVALFVQLARAIFQPSRIKHKCPECGLNRHEPDAIHCKHCGEPLKIETQGETGA